MTSPPTRNWIRFAKTASKSRSVLAFRTRRSTPSVLAADCRSRFTRLSFGNSGVGRVNQQGHDLCVRDDFVQQLQSLRRYLYVQVGSTRDVAAGSIKTDDEAELDWIAGHFEDDRNSRGRRLGRKRG